MHIKFAHKPSANEHRPDKGLEWTADHKNEFKFEFWSAVKHNRHWKT